MASIRFIRHVASGAVLAKLPRDGRGNGEFPERFYDRIGNNPNRQLNFRIKPGFTDTEGGITDSGRGRTPAIQARIDSLTQELSNGPAIFEQFNERTEASQFQQRKEATQSQNNLIRNALLVGGALLLL